MVQSLLDKTVLDTHELHGARGALVELEDQGQWGPVIGLGILGKEQLGKDSGVDTSGGMADHNDSRTSQYVSSHDSSNDSSKSPPSEYPPDSTSTWTGYNHSPSSYTMDNYTPGVNWVSDPNGAAYRGLNTRHEDGVYDPPPEMNMSTSSFGANKSNDATSGYNDSMDGLWESQTN
ncbi:uncharacterized protein SPPG_07790 [Spizellomyces punctatus DAOM BR117]|uniref:Uncharacterized protein n=1 Tax=Spizellomyces punctatus (strain DAOM BR117) TaxID=645134 RepID=A0A0L0H7M6_SPIPD|nr:uncharacterized protein SPPG_07790 [Spizellomyces punctatus DAOM BR117]KNC96969.1 hypothetical protein SPPG_07790 [Spizellomyces punctatus DAOM BR117]|eukprot:XP_016605009.1 hypothetical protein SPPG_07790 [Spizellomyces punctatus DAOM BR117]